MNYSSFSDYINKEFPSKYLRASDIQGRGVRVKINRVAAEEVFNKQTNKKSNRFVAYFEGKDKGVILSKGRTEDLKNMFGDNPQASVGKEVLMVSRFESGKNQIRFQSISGNYEPDYSSEEVDLETIQVS